MKVCFHALYNLNHQETDSQIQSSIGMQTHTGEYLHPDSVQLCLNKLQVMCAAFLNMDFFFLFCPIFLDRLTRNILYFEDTLLTELLCLIHNLNLTPVPTGSTGEKLCLTWGPNPAPPAPPPPSAWGLAVWSWTGNERHLQRRVLYPSAHPPSGETRGKKKTSCFPIRLHIRSHFQDFKLKLFKSNLSVICFEEQRKKDKTHKQLLSKYMRKKNTENIIYIFLCGFGLCLTHLWLIKVIKVINCSGRKRKNKLMRHLDEFRNDKQVQFKYKQSLYNLPFDHIAQYKPIQTVIHTWTSMHKLCVLLPPSRCRSGWGSSPPLL